MVVTYSTKIKEILNGINIIELDSDKINQNGIFLVFDGIVTDEELKSRYLFSIYIATNSLNRDNTSAYPRIDEIYGKFKEYKRKCRRLTLGEMSPFEISKLKIYRFEVSFEE